jgi:hypothetical protein
VRKVRFLVDPTIGWRRHEWRFRVRFEPLGLRSRTVDDLDGPRMAAQGGEPTFAEPVVNGQVAPQAGSLVLSIGPQKRILVDR